MFSNTPKGAKISSIYYSLIESAKENGLEPFKYLSYVFQNAPNLGQPGYANDVFDLLPYIAGKPIDLIKDKEKAVETLYPWED